MATGTAVDVVMPQMGVSVSEGTVTKWLKNPGDTVRIRALGSSSPSAFACPSAENLKPNDPRRRFAVPGSDGTTTFGGSEVTTLMLPLHDG